MHTTPITTMFTCLRNCLFANDTKPNGTLALVIFLTSDLASPKQLNVGSCLQTPNYDANSLRLQPQFYKTTYNTSYFIIIINYMINYCTSEVDRFIKRGGGCFYEERDNCQFFPDCPPSCLLVWISRDLEQSVTQPRETRACVLIAYTRRKHNVSETKHNFIVVVCFLL